MNTETFKALVLEKTDDRVAASVRELAEDALPPGDVTVAVECSSLNYKDALILLGKGGLVRNYPHVPGIDLAGTVTHAEGGPFAVGDRVLLTGWFVGERHWGGYAQRARLKSDWLVPLPEGLTPRRAMAIGTAGFTAMLALIALEHHGLEPGAGEVLVTGATGGVGSVACALLAHHGYRVVASTGKKEAHDYLRSLGAAEILEREALSEPSPRPLEKERWAAAIDSVGGHTLANVLKGLRYGGSVAACGLAGGADLPASVIPFLLRGVSLLGIDSVQCPMPRRREAWRRLAVEMPVETLDAMTRVVGLGEVAALAPEMLAGRLRGRTVVDVNA